MRTEPGLPPRARVYVATVIVAGAAVFVAMFPFSYPRPALFAFLLLAACLTSIWKVNLPIALSSGSTLSVSYAANLMALMLLGPSSAVVIAVMGAWTQCTINIKRKYPVYRTVFSLAGEALTMAATGVAYVALGGPLLPTDFASFLGPLVGAIATYFLVNTAIVAGAIALSTGRRFHKVWRDDFMWSGPSFMVAGSAGALAAVVIARGQHWFALLMLAPVYLTYRTYQLFVARLEDQKQHVLEIETLHQETVAALAQARRAEHALADEKERLAAALVEMRRLEDARMRLLEREKAARASAEEASRMKDQFLAMVSHELRTPLNAVLGWADMLRTGGLADDRRDRACQAIVGSARRQAQLIDELLDVARIMSGKLRLERTAVDLVSIVGTALEVVQAAADAKRIRVEVDDDPAIGPMYADGARLQQIVWNLLSNAVKFTPEGGVVLLRLRRAGNAAEIQVTDNGEGIPPAFLPSVFEPFRQADGTTTRSHSGLGLGLSIVHHLVEAHGGTVKAESGGAGRGATFTVRLPIVSVRTQSADRFEDTGTLQPTTLEGLAVLVVDDDDDNRDVLAAHLENCNAKVLTAASAAQALAVLDRERVDVLLSDVAMPGEDGYSLIRRVRSSPRASTSSVPAAALTAFAREEDRERALRSGFQLHLVKPIDAGTLIAAVAALGRLNPT